MPTSPTRRTQEERSASTRRRLIQAALDALFEDGYAGTTTAAIASRAGVSRGALTHHFETKEELVAEAIEQLLADSIEEIRNLAVEVEQERLSVDGFLDHLWRMFSGRLFLVTLEHLTAARHSPSLKARLVPVVRRFDRHLDLIWRDFFKGSGLSEGHLETTLNATLCLLRGMGIQTVLRNDPAYYDGLLTWWKAEMRRFTHASSNPRRVRAI